MIFNTLNMGVKKLVKFLFLHSKIKKKNQSRKLMRNLMLTINIMNFLVVSIITLGSLKKS